MATLAAALSVGPSAAHAQVSTVETPAIPKACTSNFWYISGNRVNIRQQPGGKITGRANAWERVDVFWRNGSWVYVYFKNRPLSVHPRAGYVHQDYVEFHQPTC
jgi:hypothetical protein